MAGGVPSDGRIDWNWPVRRIFNLVRAVTHPYPGAFCEAGGRRLFIWQAKVGQEAGIHGAPGTIIGQAPGGVVEVAAAAGSLIVARVQFEGEAGNGRGASIEARGGRPRS